MPKQEFEAVLEKPDAAGTWTYFTVPFKVEEVFETKAQVKVAGTINDVPFRSSLIPHGDGVHYMVVNKGIRERAGVGRGDVVKVVMDIDTAPRKVIVPAAFKELLEQSPGARTNFEDLSYSHKKEYVSWFEEAKREETRERRMNKAVEMLSQGKKLK